MPISGPHFRFLAAVIATVGFASACGGPPPRPVSRPDPTPEEDAPTPQWLFVSESGKPARGPKAECEKVREFVIGDKRCTGELCEHARDLGREWLKRCAKDAPDQVGEVRKVVNDIAERVDMKSDACIHEGNRLLRTNECGKPEACVKQAQRWISKCGDWYATPLVVTILTKRSERRFTEPTKVEFDTRSCKVMQQSLSKGIGCDGPEKCKETADTVTAWQERCRKEGEGIPIGVAFAMADVLVGASRDVEPIQVDAEGERLDDPAFPLTIKDGKGTAAWVCGERPMTMEAYLAARAKCSPGEIIFSRLDAHRVRTVSVPHATDAEFSRLFPFLDLRNEREAREKAELPAFARKLREAIDTAGSGKASAAAAQLAAVLLPNAEAISHNLAYKKLLVDADLALQPALREWGKRKAKARVADTTEAALFAGRSLDNPLHDLRLDGSVLPGSFAAPKELAWSEWMPESYTAYRKELSKLEATAKKKLSEARLESVKERLDAEITSCAAAEAAVNKAEEASAACLFREASCQPARAVSLSQAADADRDRLSAAQRNIAFILSSGIYSRTEVQDIEARKIAAGCMD